VPSQSQVAIRMVRRYLCLDPEAKV
jgi:hypothetical protein